MGTPATRTRGGWRSREAAPIQTVILCKPRFAVASRSFAAYDFANNQRRAQEEIAQRNLIVDQTPKAQWQANVISGEDGPTHAAAESHSGGNGGSPHAADLNVTPPLKVSGTEKIAVPLISLGSSDGDCAPAGKTIDLSQCQPSFVSKTDLAKLVPLAVPAAIEMAEGYLELVTKPAVQLGVSGKRRRDFARKALKLAVQHGICLVPKYEARRQMVIGQSRRLLKRYEGAASAFRRAAKHRPLRLDALIGLGWCQKRTGRVDLAVVSLTRALAIAPEDPRLHYNLACYLSLSGQFRAAVYELAWALELEPALRHRAVIEPDFDPIHASPAFAALTSARRSGK
jgi:tetratricopeptide (TPR) repeat protein